MSNEKPFHVHINLNGNEIRNVLVEKLASDPVSPAAARFWYNTTENKLKYYDGTAVRVVATEAYVEAAIQQIGASQGGFDASGGSLPVVGDLIDGDTAIRRGDYWDITVAGSIAGIGGAPELSIGDVLKFVGTDAGDPAHWLGIQRNLNDTLIGNAKTEKQTVALVANTPLNVNAATLSEIFSVQVFNSAGQEIMVSIETIGPANQVTLTSNTSLTGVIVRMVGAS